MKRYVLMLMLILLFVMAVFASEVKIGVCLPFSGDGQVDARDAWQAIQLAHESMSSVGSYQITLMKADDNTDPKMTQKVTQNLIDDGAVVLIGYPWSSLAIPGASVAEKAKVPLVSTWSTNPLTTQGKKYVSRVCFIDPFQGEVAANFVVNELKVKNVVLIVDKSEPYCTGLATYFKRSFLKLKGRILLSLYFKRGDPISTLEGLAKRAFALHPDMVYIPAYPRELGNLIKSLRKLGYNGVLMAGDTGGTSDVYKYAGDSVNGFYYTDHFNAEAAKTETAKHFISAFEKRYGRVPGAGSALGWDAYMVVYNAIKSCVSMDKEVNSENINYYIRHTKNLECATANLTIDPETGNPVKSAVVNVWKEGKIKLYEVVNP